MEEEPLSPVGWGLAADGGAAAGCRCHRETAQRPSSPCPSTTRGQQPVKEVAGERRRHRSGRQGLPPLLLHERDHQVEGTDRRCWIRAGKDRRCQGGEWPCGDVAGGACRFASDPGASPISRLRRAPSIYGK